MKVLFIQNIEGIAGSEKYFLQLIPELEKRGVEVEFLSVYLHSHKEGYQQFQALLDEKGIRSYALSTKKYPSPKLIFKLKTFFKEHQYDIVHSHLIYADFWMASLRKMGWMKHTKLISTLHGYQEKIYVDYCLKPEELPKNLYYRIAKFSYAKLDHVYACSHGLKEFYSKSSIQFPQGIDVIQHGFDYPDVDTREEPRDRKIVTIIGRVIPRKGHVLVLEQFQKVMDQFPDVLLRIVGDGSDLALLKQMVKQKGLEKNVEFTGFQSNVHYYYQNSDVVLVPSYAEGLPLVIFEAYNHSKPVIAFETIGPAEAVEDGRTGYLVPPFQAEVFADKIIQLLKDEVAIERYGKRAKELLESHFTIQRMTDETLEYYQKILKK
ncbi:MAG: glycosyltransferase family 4 protein [Crocinitomicaceae bacterium]|nr:glycosyltransferase family 4 protein [Crocinitomicaceae bacterium]